MSFKLWRKTIKRKRLRMPDILCLDCGVRFESRGKTNMRISMSHSLTDATRAWDVGLDDGDFVALVGVTSGDSRDLLAQLPPCSVDLAITSPPFALQRQKAYGNQEQSAYVDWLVEFCRLVYRVLKPTGSFVLDLGGAYEKGRPVRSLYNFRVPIRLCDDLGYRLAEDFYWHNPARLPSPIEWVNKRKIRAKDSVDIVYWFSKEDEPKADVRRVLTPYSDRMKKLLEDPAKFYSPKKRPSGHDIGSRFGSANGGAIPSNLLQIANTESNSPYLRFCRATQTAGHPARFPEKLPRFFIDFLTEPGDLVVDFFAGSNTTGLAAERANRRWMAFELNT